MRYFIGNWKMFGIPSSDKILYKINAFFKRDKNNKKKYKIIIAPPFTLLHDFSKRFKSSKISISSQNCYHKDFYGAHTGNISPFMIKKLGINYTLIGHSENRASGENNKLIGEKISLALKNKLSVILCIGENKIEKRNKKTFSVLKKQLSQSITSKKYLKKIIIAYEPLWSIGSGRVPSKNELEKIIVNIKKYLNKKFRLKRKNIRILYGGSVDKQSVLNFKAINELDGFLIGGASKSSKNFIDIIKNFYK